MQSLAFDPEGLTLASAGRQEPLLWDVVTGKQFLRLTGGSGSDARGLAFDRKGRRLIHAAQPDSAQSAIVLWEVHSPRGIRSLRGLTSPLRQIWFSRDSRLVAALSDHWEIGIWEVASGHLLFVFESPVGGLADNAGGCFSPVGDQFAFATGYEASMYEVTTGKLLHRWPLPPGLWDQVQFDDQGCALLLRQERPHPSSRPIWRLYNLVDSEAPILLKEQSGTNWQANGMAFAPGGKRFLVWDIHGDGSTAIVRGFDPTTGEELWRERSQPAGESLFMRIDPSGRRFAFRNRKYSGRLCLMDFTSFKEVGTVPGTYSSLSPLGPGLDSNGWITLDPTSSQRAFPLTTDYTANYMSGFSPDGKFVAQATEQGVLVLVDLEEFQRRLARFGYRRK